MLVNQTSQQVNPCDNFYRHVCSKWIDENYLTRYETERSRMRLINNGYISQIHDIFKSMTIDSALQTAKEKAAALFIGCMDRDTIEELGADPLRKFLFNFGFKTFPTNLHERKTLDVSQVAGLVLRKLGISTFVSASVVADPELKEDRILSVMGHLVCG
ncbi:neprilysin-1-like [Ornithodoros turicata]|uniref:neprilysin-1-like n=1 Tax=Ornithodoros turicata TaxID=34597 RepID=UPI00313A3E6B